MRKLKDQKVFRFIGVTTHLGAAALKDALEAYEFDTVLTTFNPTKERLEYEELVLPVARKQNLGTIAMKIMGGATKYNLTTLDGLPAAFMRVTAGTSDTLEHCDYAVFVLKKPVLRCALKPFARAVRT